MEKSFFNTLRKLGLGALLILVGCHPAVSILPPHIHTVGVPTADNHTSQYGVETEITSQVIHQFETDGRLVLASDKSADLLVKISVRQYQKDVLLTNTANNRPEQYRLSVVYDLSAVDQVDQRPLFEDKGKTRSVFFNTSDYPGSIVETEDQAFQRLTDDLARSVVRRVIEGS